ncbi:MAG: phosphoglycerate mutase family protein [Promethearchaeia archaeon]
MDLIETADVSFRDKTVFIVRHAQGQHNVSPRFEFDPPLTEDGHKQVSQPVPRHSFVCEQVKSRAKIATKLSVDLVVVSPLRRTLQTASGVR